MSGQTSVREQLSGFAGLRTGMQHKARSGCNAAGTVRKVVEFTISTAVASTAYTIVVAGQTIVYTSGATTSKPAIRDGLIAAVIANAIAVAVAFPNPTASDKFTLTQVQIGTDFTATEADANIATPVVLQAFAATQPIPFGYGVVLSSLGGDNVMLPTATGQKFRGVCERVHCLTDPLHSILDGAKPGATLSLIHEGLVWVPVDQAVAVGDPVFLRHTSGVPGTFRMDADTANADAISGAIFETAAAAGGIAIANFNTP